MKRFVIAMTITCLAFLLIGNWTEIHAQAGGTLETPLMEAAGEGNLAMAKFLIENQGVSVNATDAEGNTALIAAAGACQSKISEYLIEKGADVNSKNSSYGATALSIAAGKCHDPREIRVLLDHHAEVHVRNKGGDTPLLIAVKHGNLQAVAMLLQAGAEINGQNEGYTSLMVASLRGYTGIVKLLINNHADLNFQNQSGETALSLAQNYAQSKVVELLKAAGAREKFKPRPNYPPGN